MEGTRTGPPLRLSRAAFLAVVALTALVTYLTTTALQSTSKPGASLRGAQHLSDSQKLRELQSVRTKSKSTGFYVHPDDGIYLAKAKKVSSRHQRAKTLSLGVSPGKPSDQIGARPAKRAQPSRPSTAAQQAEHDIAVVQVIRSVVLRCTFCRLGQTRSTSTPRTRATLSCKQAARASTRCLR